EFMDILHLKTNAIVSNEHDDLIVVAIGASYLNLSLRACAGEFHSIRKKIDECQSQHCTVSIDLRQGANAPHNMAPLGLLLDSTDRFFDQLFQTDHSLLRLRTSYA